MSARLFQSFFPTPSFLRMPSVGLDISDKSVRFLGLRETSNGIRVGRSEERRVGKECRL